MLDKIGTFEYVGLDEGTLKTALSDKCSIGTITQVTEIPNGVNTTAILHTETGDYFVKLHSFNTDEDVFHAQPFLLKYFDEVDVPFHTATPVGYDYTKQSLRYDWYITEAITGEIMDTETTDISIEKAEQVGAILGQINSIETPGYGYTTGPNKETSSCEIDPKLPFDGNSWDEEFTEATLELLTTMDSRFMDLYEPLEQYVTDTTPRESTPHLLHFDFWWENIMWDDDTPYIIDWERAVGGDPLANRILSEHYLFDTVAINSSHFSTSYYTEDRSELRERFRNAYTSAYSGSVSLTADTETHELYELLVYIRELRGFPYWWRNETESWRDKREKALREGITELI